MLAGQIGGETLFIVNINVPSGPDDPRLATAAHIVPYRCHEFADLGIFTGATADGDQCCCASGSKQANSCDPSSCPLPHLFQNGPGACVITGTGQGQPQVQEIMPPPFKARLRGRDRV